MNIVSTVRQEEVIIVMCGGGTEVGCWLGLEGKNQEKQMEPAAKFP